MKKMILSVLATALILNASAQLSIGVNGNYTMYKGVFKQNTKGFGARVAYQFYDKIGITLSYTNPADIIVPSTVDVYDNSGGSKTLASEIQYSFKSFHLLVNYTFIGKAESAGKFYGLLGGGLVIINYKENIKDDYDKNAYTTSNQIQPGKESGPTINLGLGGEYKFGAPSAFIEVCAALPASQKGNTYFQNYIPFHFIFNAGIKFPIGHR